MIVFILDIVQIKFRYKIILKNIITLFETEKIVLIFLNYYNSLKSLIR
jgi:hypothetical protein